MVVNSVDGIQSYSRSLKVKAAADQLNLLHEAGEKFLADNFKSLVDAGSAEYDMSVLSPYLGATITRDPFGAAYKIGTRGFSYTIPDPVNGTPITRNSIRMFISAYNEGNADTELPLKTDRMLPVDIAAAAGPNAGWFTWQDNQCFEPDGTPLKARDLCSAFGTFTVDRDENNNANWAGIGFSYYLTQIYTRDSDKQYNQIHRYDVGDPELNTMRADLYMDTRDNHATENKIRDATEIHGPELIGMRGAVADFRNESGNISIESGSEIHFSTDDNDLVIASYDDTERTTIRSQSGAIQFGTDDDALIIGDSRANSGSAPSEVDGYVAAMNKSVDDATGTILTGRSFGNETRTAELNSLLMRPQDPLKLQNVRRGEVTVGLRGRYRPPSGLSSDEPIYELADGMVTAGHVKAQDFTCADCGGSLSDILPRWRHMGTYFVENNTTYKDIPKPNCTTNRRDTYTRNRIGDRHHEYNETDTDERYLANIILVPKQAMKERYDRGRFNIQLEAEDIGTSWRVRTDFNDDNVLVEALAMTYCVFVGGGAQKVDITNPGNANYFTRKDHPAGGGYWTRLVEDAPLAGFVDPNE